MGRTNCFVISFLYFVTRCFHVCFIFYFCVLLPVTSSYIFAAKRLFVCDAYILFTYILSYLYYISKSLLKCCNIFIVLYFVCFVFFTCWNQHIINNIIICVYFYMKRKLCNKKKK